MKLAPEAGASDDATWLRNQRRSSARCLRRSTSSSVDDDREGTDPELIDEIVLEQRLYEVAAPLDHDDGPATRGHSR